VRVLLLNPPSPERLGAPLLGLQYVAAALLAAGFEVRVIDAAARGFLHDDAWIADQVRQWQPRIVGLPLFTRWVWHAYRLLPRLRGCGALLVAGGAHATVRPHEALDQGFDVALTGEAEHTLVQLARALRDGMPLEHVPGAWVRQPGGGHEAGPPAAFIEDLDGLAPPYRAQPLFDAAWYGAAGGTVVPGGILTSRGCPAGCTFCANVVTGRRFRSRSAAGVVDELNAWNSISRATFFPFWDDAFTVDAPRLPGLCDALRRGCRFPLSFSAITRVGSVTPALLRQLREAGLVHVNFGVESGDDDILRAIRKGLRTDQVVQALQWAKDLGLQTACNFMLGFPQDTPASLERTARFMERIAPLVDSFSTLGVVVPFPGTALYDEYHCSHGFTDWWLDERFSRWTAPPPPGDPGFARHYLDDDNLALDFFRYDADTRSLIRECLRIKGEHNLRAMGLPMTDPQRSPLGRAEVPA
jgi:anaerobic magnesium-protoporphyrin IX monomethyl ester cyclase